MTAARIVADLSNGWSISSIARRLQMTVPVARDMLSADDRRALILGDLREGMSMFGAARRIGLRTADALALFGVDDPAADTPADLAAVIAARFDGGVSASKIVYALDLTQARVNRVLWAHRPVQFATQKLLGGAAPGAIAAQISPAALAQAQAAVSATRVAGQPAPNRHPRLILRTDDGRTTIATDPGSLCDARRMMTRLARGRAWTEGNL